LCRKSCNNPVIVGEPDTVRVSVVEALAQRIADGSVPHILEGKKLIALDLSAVETKCSGPAQFKERLRTLVKELSGSQNVILFIVELCATLASLSPDGRLDAAGVFEPALLRGTICCVSATTTNGFREVIAKHPRLADCFHEVQASSLTEAECMPVLLEIKERLEEFHQVVFHEDAIAVVLALVRQRNPTRSFLVDAIDLLDESAAYVQMRRTDVPEEIREVRKRIKFIVHRMDSAIANHEFEKARFYSDEERKEQENLRVLNVKYQAAGCDAIVTRKDIEDVAAIRTSSIII